MGGDRDEGEEREDTVKVRTPVAMAFLLGVLCII
jgi:hypothetical protein